MYVFHLAISVIVVLVHDCLSLLVVTLKLYVSYICDLGRWLSVKVLRCMRPSCAKNGAVTVSKQALLPLVQGWRTLEAQVAG